MALINKSSVLRGMISSMGVISPTSYLQGNNMFQKTPPPQPKFSNGTYNPGASRIPISEEAPRSTSATSNFAFIQRGERILNPGAPVIIDTESSIDLNTEAGRDIII